MLVILKIPIVYIAVVIWWAIKAEPERGELEGVVVLSDTPPSGSAPRADGRAPDVRFAHTRRDAVLAPRRAVQRGTVRP